MTQRITYNYNQTQSPIEPNFSKYSHSSEEIVVDANLNAAVGIATTVKRPKIVSKQALNRLKIVDKVSNIESGIGNEIFEQPKTNLTKLPSTFQTIKNFFTGENHISDVADHHKQNSGSVNLDNRSFSVNENWREWGLLERKFLSYFSILC